MLNAKPTYAEIVRMADALKTNSPENLAGSGIQFPQVAFP